MIDDIVNQDIEEEHKSKKRFPTLTQYQNFKILSLNKKEHNLQETLKSLHERFKKENFVHLTDESFSNLIYNVNARTYTYDNGMINVESYTNKFTDKLSKIKVKQFFDPSIPSRNNYSDIQDMIISCRKYNK